MSEETAWVVVGRFGRAHGLKGQIIVHSFTNPRDNIVGYDDWHVRTHQQWQPVNLLRVDVTNKHILATVENMRNPEQVAALTNADIAIKQEQLPTLPPGEFYWHELMGMKVVNLEGLTLGEVTEVMPTGSNDVLVVENGKRHLIPYLQEQFIKNIDKNQNLITVDWDVDF